MLLVARKSRSEPKIAGYILIYVHKLSARIYSLAVHPDFQGHGAAKTLLENALEKLTCTDISTVKLEFRKSNIRLKKLYESFGFKQKVVLEDYYGDHEAAISMSLTHNRFKHITTNENLNGLTQHYFLTESRIQGIHLPN